MAAITSKAVTGNASIGSNWVGEVAPADGDTISIANGAVITQDVDRSYGSNVSGVGDAVVINGASAGSYGTYKVAAGVTLTLKGTGGIDGTGNPINQLMMINQHARFEPQPGCTILGDCASDGQTKIDNRGYLIAQGTELNPITFGIPAANYSWNNSATGDTASTTAYYDPVRKIVALALDRPWISNAAGNDLGSLGDTSLSFTASSPAGSLTNEVATLDLIVSNGDYYVNYETGTVFAKNTNLVSFTASYKYLTYTNGWWISSVQNATANEAVFDHCVFDKFGTFLNAFVWGLDFSYKKSATVAVNRRAEVTNCLFRYCRRPVGIRDCDGTSGDYLLFTDNTFIATIGDGFGGTITAMWASSSYVDCSRNRFLATVWTPYTLTGYGSISRIQNWLINNNVVFGHQFITGTLLVALPNTEIADCVHLGFGGAADNRSIGTTYGESGSPVSISGTLIARSNRAINYGRYCTLDGNVIYHSYHHGISSDASNSDIHLPGVQIINNVITAPDGSEGALIELGYNHRTFTDGPIVENNTLHLSVGQGGLSLGDNGDGFGAHLLTGASLRANLITSNTTGIRRPTDTAANRAVPGLKALDWNNLYDNTADYANYNRQATFERSTVAYNADGSRNVAGVDLFDPSYATAQAGRALVLTVTALNTDVTLAWGGGTAVQLVFDSGTATAGTADTGYGIRGNLTDSAKTWNTNFNNTACPTGKWVKITGGTGSGQIRRITNNTASTLTVAPAWATAPDATSTYTIYHAERQLFDSGATDYVRCGIDLRTMPTATQSDTGIEIAFHGFAVDPMYLAPTRSLASWDSSLGGSGGEHAGLLRLWNDPTLTVEAVTHIRNGFQPRNSLLRNAGPDGTTPGAVEFSSGGRTGMNHRTLRPY